MADLMLPANWFVADTTVDGMYGHLVSQLTTMRKLRLERPSPDTLVIHHQTAPGWWWVRSAQTATIRGIDVEGGARFTATGRTSPVALVAIHQAFGVPEDGHANPPPTSADDADSALDRIQELASLRDRGILTEDEFEIAKARLLRDNLTDEPER